MAHNNSSKNHKNDAIFSNLKLALEQVNSGKHLDELQNIDNYLPQYVTAAEKYSDDYYVKAFDTAYDIVAFETIPSPWGKAKSIGNITTYGIEALIYNKAAGNLKTNPTLVGEDTARLNNLYNNVGEAAGSIYFAQRALQGINEHKSDSFKTALQYYDFETALAISLEQEKKAYELEIIDSLNRLSLLNIYKKNVEDEVNRINERDLYLTSEIVQQGVDTPMGWENLERSNNEMLKMGKDYIDLINTSKTIDFLIEKQTNNIGDLLRWENPTDGLDMFEAATIKSGSVDQWMKPFTLYAYDALMEGAQVEAELRVAEMEREIELYSQEKSPYHNLKRWMTGGLQGPADVTRAEMERLNDQIREGNSPFDQLKRAGSTVWKNTSQAEIQRHESDAMVRDAQMDMLQGAWNTMLNNANQAELQRHESDAMVRDAQMDMLQGAWSTMLNNANQAELQKYESDVMVRDAQMDMLQGAWSTLMENASQAELQKHQADEIVRDAGMDMWKEYIDKIKNKPRSVSNGKNPSVEPISYNPSGGRNTSKRVTSEPKRSTAGANSGKSSYKTQIPQKTSSKAGQVSKTNMKPNGSGLRSDNIIKNLEKSMGLVNTNMKKVNNSNANKKQNSKISVDMKTSSNKNTSAGNVNNNQAVSSSSRVAGQSNSTKTYITGGSLDYVNSIKSPIEIEEDKIQMLKDVAEREYNLKYAQVTPQMTVQFGDVRETADVNNILSAIEQMTADALKSSLIGGL